MKDLLEKIKDRYERESKSDCTLGCGTNLLYLNLTQGERILDMGCGKGRETIQAAKMVGEYGLAVGLDITDNMIDTARKNAEDENLKNTEFVLGNIENLEFEDNFFDAVISNCVINHAKDKYMVYKEIYRVLQSRGRFIISDAVTKNPLPESIKNDPNHWAECFGGAVTKEEYLESINKAGFSKIEILNQREYLKNGYDFISLTIKAYK